MSYLVHLFEAHLANGKRRRMTATVEVPTLLALLDHCAKEYGEAVFLVFIQT